MKPRVLTFCALAVLAGCQLAALSGCQKNSSPARMAQKAAHAKSLPTASAGPTPEEMTAGMVEAVTQGKSQAPVTLKFDLLQRPTEGQPLEVAIALLPQIEASQAKVDVSGSEGLNLAAPDNEFEFDAIEPAQVYRHRIKVTPSAEGVYLLTLSVSLKHDPFDDTRVFSVPVIVVPAADSPGKSVGAAPAGAASPPAANPPHRGQ
jgi:hypothetical protein